MIQVAAGNPRSADKKLTRNPDGNRLPIFIEYISGGIRNRTSDRHHDGIV